MVNRVLGLAELKRGRVGKSLLAPVLEFQDGIDCLRGADSAQRGQGVLLELSLSAVGGEEVLEYSDGPGRAIGLKLLYRPEARVLVADLEGPSRVESSVNSIFLSDLRSGSAADAITGSKTTRTTKIRGLRLVRNILQLLSLR